MGDAPERGWFEVDGGRLYYEYDRRGSGPALLFAHGSSLDIRTWRSQLEAFAGQRPCLSYDARGHGQSSLPGSEPFRHCDDAAALCERLGLKRVIAVGHSVGAGSMLELTLAQPDLVAGFVSICMSDLVGIAAPREVIQMRATLIRMALTQGIDAAKTMFRDAAWFGPAREVPALARELDAMLTDYSGWHWVHESRAVGLDPSAAARLQDVRIPALIITGGRDLAYTASIGETLMAGLVGATSLHIDHAGHMANMEAPAIVNRGIQLLVERI